MTANMQKPIVIFRGDNTAAFDLRTIKILLTGDLDLTNATARFDLLGFTKSWTAEEVATGELSIVFTAEQTKAFALGPQSGILRLFDMSTGTPRQLTIVNNIPFFVTNRVCEIDSQSYGINVSVTSGETIHIEFNVGGGDGKADKVKNATAGDLASLTANGNLEDSGIPKTDVQRKLTFDDTPTAGSQNPVTSDGIKQAIDAATPEDYAQVKAQVEQNTTDISTIEGKIPAQASAQNQLADKSFVNSSIATNTANFLGTYDYVTDLGFPQPSSSADVSNAAIATALGSLTFPQTPTNNDYIFVQIDYTATTPADEFRRFKFNGTAWAYEYTLNNSSFTANQWAAINSGITSGDVAKLGALPTAQELAASLLAKYEKPSGGIPKTDLSSGVQASLDKADTALQTAPVTKVNNKTGDVTLALNDVCQDIENWLGTPNTTDAGKSIKVLAKTVNGVIEGGVTVTASSSNDNNSTKYRYGGVTATRNGVATDYLFDNSQSGIARRSDIAVKSVKLNGTAITPDANGAVDVQALGNTGNQTLNGTLTLGHTRLEENKIVYDVGAAGESNLMFPPGVSGYLALLSDIYAAVQQIAPDFTAKAYAANELCSYNGVVYRCTTAIETAEEWTAAHWTEATVSELFLPLTGGEISGDLLVNGQVNISAFFTIARVIGSGLLFTGNIENVQHRALLPLANASNSPSFSTIAFLQNLAPYYDATSTYELNNLCVYIHKLYRCTTAIETAEEWTAAHWTEATVEDVLAAIRLALDTKAPLASPAFTGTPTAPTPTSGDNSTKVATTAFVKTAVDGATPNLDYVMRVNPETGEIYYTTPDANANA